MPYNRLCNAGSKKDGESMQDALPSVSVVVPIYNVERYLPQCLEALCSQTLRDLEIVAVNDGSTARIAVCFAGVGAEGRAHRHRRPSRIRGTALL